MTEEAIRAKREYMKRWREKNREKLKDYQREYRKKNRDQVNASHREWSARNRDKIVKYNQSYWERVAERDRAE